MTNQNISRFRELIVGDQSLTAQLYALESKDEFMASVIEIGTTHGILLTESELATAINAGARSWLERWI